MLRIEHLNVYYGESHVLRDVDLHIPPGQVVCLMGRNGMGKTTLLKSIAGLLRPKRGKIHFAEEDITGRPPSQRAARGMGYVPQGREIFPNLTVQENLQLGLEALRGRGHSVPQDVFELFPALQSILSRQGGNLSGGEQQQLAIARALVARPKLLLLDEPTEGIQPSIILQIENAIRRLKEQRTVSILLVEQYLAFAWRLADSYYVMEGGSIVSEGSTEKIDQEIVKKHLTV